MNQDMIKILEATIEKLHLFHLKLAHDRSSNPELRTKIILCMSDITKLITELKK